MKYVQLINGKVLPLTLVQGYMMSIKNLVEKDFIAFTHLLEYATNPGYSESHMPHFIKDTLHEYFVILGEGLEDVVSSCYDAKNMALRNPIVKIMDSDLGVVPIKSELSNNIHAVPGLVTAEISSSAVSNNSVAYIGRAGDDIELGIMPASGASEVVDTAMKSDATLTTKMLDYLSNNKGTALFVTALVGYGIYYDYYHENNIGKAAAIIKNSLYSFWNRPVEVSAQKEESVSNEKERTLDCSFAGL